MPSFRQLPSRQRLSRFQKCSLLPSLLVVTVGLSCLGCWQEVHYEPSGAPAEPTAQPDVLQAEVIEPGEIVPEEIAPEVAIAPQTVEGVGDRYASPVGSPGERLKVEVQDPWAEANLPAVKPEEMPVEKAVPEEAGRTTLAAWLMGSQWSMAAALQAKGEKETRYGKQLAQAREEAAVLGATLPELPWYEAADDRLSGSLTFLREEAGPRLAGELRMKHGETHAALVELATKTHVLLLSYSPSSTKLEPVIAAIRHAAENSGLPKTVWRELVDLLTARASFRQVKSAVYQLHRRAEAFLLDESH